MMNRAQLLNRDTYIVFVVRTLWENLPQVIGGGLLFSLCCVPAFVLFGIGLLAPTVLVAVVTVAPAWCALLAFTSALIQGDRVSGLRFWRTVRHHGYAAALLSMLLAFPLLITLQLLPLLQVEPVPLILWLGVGLSSFAVALAAALLFYAMPMLPDHPASLPDLLRTALTLAAQQPANTVGLLALGLLFIFLVAYVSLGLVLLLPAIYALFVVANLQLVQNCLPPEAE